jgi:hypothetical protein
MIAGLLIFTNAVCRTSTADKTVSETATALPAAL